MKKNMDKIQFEYRSEIDVIANALDTYLKDHTDAKDKDTIKELVELLDSMYMGW